MSMNCDRKIGDPFKWQNSFPGLVPRTRLPITGSILNGLVTALNQTCSNPFYQRLYKAMHLLAFYGFLRLGGITERSQGSLDSHCLKYSDVVVHHIVYDLRP
jgi:hypothetical protein